MSVFCFIIHELLLTLHRPQSHVEARERVFQGLGYICSVVEQDIIDAFTERLILGYQNFATSNISVRNGAAVDARWCVILSRTCYPALNGRLRACIIT